MPPQSWPRPGVQSSGRRASRAATTGQPDHDPPVYDYDPYSSKEIQGSVGIPQAGLQAVATDSLPFVRPCHVTRARLVWRLS
jgi:hypothetical protein